MHVYIIRSLKEEELQNPMGGPSYPSINLHFYVLFHRRAAARISQKKKRLFDINYDLESR